MYTLLRQSERISAAQACLQAVGEGGGSGSSSASPPAHGGGCPARYQLDERMAAKRRGEGWPVTMKLPLTLGTTDNKTKGKSAFIILLYDYPHVKVKKIT